jgi:AraC-like DNA-binding protein
MNYFSFFSVTNRAQFILVKCMRIVYVCTTLLLMVHISSSKIPRWIIGMILISVTFLIGMRFYYYNEIDLYHQVPGSNIIFSVANEFYTPLPVWRFFLLIMLGLALGIILYYCSLFSKKMNKNNIYYRQLNRWIVFLLIPFFLLILFGMCMLLNVFKQSPLSAYLFSFFSLVTIVSILFRPKFLNSSQVSLAFIPLQKPIGSTISSQLFNSIFFNDFYYLEKAASLVQLAEKLNATETDTREYLQQEYGMGINDLLNKYRVAYLLDLLKHPQNREFTIEHLSQKAGFASRTTMYRAFSKFHGGYPSDYIDKLNSL